MSAPRFRLASMVLDTADPQGLAAFYRDLLGWQVRDHGDEWVGVEPPEGGPGLLFQREDGHVPPTWPPGPGDQQTQAHLDIRVDDLEAGVAHAKSLGAAMVEHQPHDDVRVMLDPAGHPFCLFAPATAGD